MGDIEEELVKGIVRNLSRVIILWILSDKTSSGYGVLKEMRRLTGQHVHPGVIYPLLYELENSKYIAGEKVQKGKRQIIYYSITDGGMEILERMRSVIQLPIVSVLQEFLKEETR